MNAIFLFGTDHRYQRGFALGVEPTIFDAFRVALRGVIARRGIRGIAEEMSVEGLGNNSNVAGSIGFQLAKELCLPHLYCDPDTETRKARSITSILDRERYWLDQLRNFEVFPALFILGSSHVESFCSALAHAGIRTLIDEQDWEPRN